MFQQRVCARVQSRMVVCRMRVITLPLEQPAECVQQLILVLVFVPRDVRLISRDVIEVFGSGSAQSQPQTAEMLLHAAVTDGNENVTTSSFERDVEEPHQTGFRLREHTESRANGNVFDVVNRKLMQIVR